MKQRVKEELKCLWPFQVHNKLNLNKHVCNNMTEFEGKYNCKQLTFQHEKHICYAFYFKILPKYGMVMYLLTGDVSQAVQLGLILWDQKGTVPKVSYHSSFIM